MRKIRTAVACLAVAAAMPACRTSNAAKVKEELNERAAEPTSVWRLDLLVNGDSNCDADRKPEPFTVDIAMEHAAVEALASVSARSLSVFLTAPFAPTQADKAFLRQPGTPIDLERAKEVAVRLFTAAFAPQFPVEFKPKILPSTGLLTGLRFVHAISVADLPAYQTWFNDTLVPNAKRNSGLQLTMEASSGQADHGALRPIIPILLYGTARATGDAPNRVVSFDANDTIVTAAAQNEAHDTTLCQLRKGIVNPDGQTKFDIPIYSVEKVTAVGGE